LVQNQFGPGARCASHWRPSTNRASRLERTGNALTFERPAGRGFAMPEPPRYRRGPTAPSRLVLRLLRARTGRLGRDSCHVFLAGKRRPAQGRLADKCSVYQPTTRHTTTKRCVPDEECLTMRESTACILALHNLVANRPCKHRTTLRTGPSWCFATRPCTRTTSSDSTSIRSVFFPSRALEL